jgi:O-antigen/teichoic acid export membrane protein
VLLHYLPASPGVPAFSKSKLVEVWRFAAGITGISVMSVIVGQIDKVILSRQLSLEAFGYYSLAWRVISGLYLLIGPVQAAYFPRLTQLVAMGDQQELARTYHRGTKLMSVIILPIVAILVLFAHEMLRVWTLNPLIADNTSAILAVLAAGIAINGLMNMPFSLQLAHGWTRLAFISAVCAVIVIAPLMWVVAVQYGGLGAAYVWVASNVGFGAATLCFMHRRLLRGHLARWLMADIAPVLAATLLVAGVWKIAIPVPEAYAGAFLSLASVTLLTAIAACLVVPEIRSVIARRLSALT